jgi:hypothetical protein
MQKWIHKTDSPPGVLSSSDKTKLLISFFFFFFFSYWNFFFIGLREETSLALLQKLSQILIEA